MDFLVFPMIFLFFPMIFQWKAPFSPEKIPIFQCRPPGCAGWWASWRSPPGAPSPDAIEPNPCLWSRAPLKTWGKFSRKKLGQTSDKHRIWLRLTYDLIAFHRSFIGVSPWQKEAKRGLRPTRPNSPGFPIKITGIQRRNFCRRWDGTLWAMVPWFPKKWARLISLLKSRHW